MGLCNNLLPEERFLIKALKDYIYDQSTSNEQNLDWSIISVIGHKHQLSAIVYCQCKNFAGSEILKNPYYVTISTSANRKKTYDAVIKAFDDNQIDYVPYKGIILANYYSQPLCRTMGDVDILVSDLDKAICVMNSLDFSGKRNNEEWGGKRNGIEFEIHSKFFCNNRSLTDKQKAFFEHYEGHVRDHQLDINYHFLLVVCHLMKHIKNGQGIGLRQFLDVALMMMREDKLNWDWIFKNAEEIELSKFLNVTLNFVNRLFDIPIPSQSTPASDEILRVLLENVMTDGSFQSSSHDRKLARKVNGRARNKLAMVFPSISYMREKYTYLVKKPILLPFAWIERIVKYGFSEKRAKSREIVITSDEIDNRRHYLSMLGIQ